MMHIALSDMNELIVSACKKCGNPKIENKETMLCGSCGLASRKSEREQIKSQNKIKKGVSGGIFSKKKIAKFSNRNTFQTTTGERYTKAQIETKVKAAKLIKKAEFIKENGYIFCEECGTTEQPIDTSHDLSVDECQKQGTVELAWFVPQLKFRCRKCHQVKDRNCINYK